MVAIIFWLSYCEGSYGNPAKTAVFCVYSSQRPEAGTVLYSPLLSIFVLGYTTAEAVVHGSL